MAGLRKYKSLYSSTSSSFGTGEGVTITPASVVGLPTTPIVLTFDRVDSVGTATPGSMERILGTVSEGNFVVSSGGRGYDGSTEQAHTSPVVEQIWNAKDWNDAVDAMSNVVSSTTGSVDTTKVPAVSGSAATTLTVTGATNVTLPTTGTLATLAGSETLTNKVVGSGTAITLGSDARGDVYYRNNSAVLARLAIGAATTFLKGGTDPSFSFAFSQFKVGTTTYDTSTTGSLAITGVGFTPKILILMGSYVGSASAGFTIGFTDGTTQHSMQQTNTGNMNASAEVGVVWTTYAGTNALLNYASFDSDGFTLTKTKNGSPTGTATLIYLCLG